MISQLQPMSPLNEKCVSDCMMLHELTHIDIDSRWMQRRPPEKLSSPACCRRTRLASVFGSWAPEGALRMAKK